MLLLFFVGVAESSAQVGEDYVSGDAQLSARFDGGRGTLWLAPHSEGRRVGESFVLRKGAALWAHPDSRATLTVGEKDLVLERGGLVALSLVDGEAVIELYVGRARPSSSAGIEVERGPWRWGQAAGAPGSVLETAVGASVFSPLVEDGKEAGVFGAVLYALDPSAALPARVEPSWMSLDIALSGVMAKLSMELRFELASSMRAQPLGLIELALPADALASAMSIEIEGQHIDARQAAGEAESSPSALIPPPSAGDGIQHVSIPLTLPSDGLVSMRVVWTMPMQLGGDTAALHLLPSSGSAAGQVERFELRVHGQGRGQLEQLWSMPPLQREGEQWTASLDDYPLANGVALAFAHQDETWAGRAEGVDGVFFAISHQPEVLDSSVGADVLFLLDLSASMAGVNLEHARGVITAAANNLNPQHDRVALLTYQSKAQVEMALTAADEAAVSQLEQTLAQAQAASTADVVNALRAASSYLLSTEREGRVVRLVLLSDRPLELSDDLEELLSMLAKDRLSLVELRLDEHTRSAEPLWAIPLLQVSAVTSPMLSAKQLIQAWDVALKPLLSYRATHDDVDALLWHRPKLCSGGPVFLLLGRHRVPQPFFDLPGRLELCLQDDEACDNPRVVELGQGGRSEMLASFYSVIADGAIPVALREELDEELGLLELRRELDWQLLDQAYSTAFHRYFYASPMRPWLDERYPSSGQRASMMDVPSASSARGEGSLPSSPKMRTDPYLRPSLEPSLPVPSISEVLLLARGGRKSTTSAASDPSSLDYTIQYYLAYSMENALSTARSAAAEALASDSQKYEAFLQAWHELGYRSNAQLYTLQSLYYAKNMYDKANLVSYDLQAMSDTSYSYGLDAQKSAIRFYLDQKLWRRAEPWLRKGLERYPSDRFFVDGMIRLLGAEGRQAELNALEIEVFSRELERNPGNGAVMDQLLVRLVDAKRSDIGRKALDSWQQRFGTSPTYYGLAAQLESLDGHPQKALTLLRTGVESFPRSRLARRLLVEALLGQGDVQAGVDSAREWLALDPENLHLRQYLGDTLFREGRYEDALAEYEGIIEARPTAALGYIKTGDALVAMKREAEASQLYAVADRLEPGNLATAMRIIESASAAGDLKTAAQAFKQARSKSSPSANQDQQKAENEHYYQLLCRWRAQALANGDDEQEREVAELLASVYVDGGGAYGTRYALRAAFVPDSISPDQVVDFRVVEPGGNVVSSIMPYNSALGSQLISYSKTGGAPRVYWLPSYDKGSFQFEISYESAQGTKPLLGKLYLHRIPRSGLEYWEQYELRLDRVGAREQLTISIDDVPKAAVFAPTR